MRVELSEWNETKIWMNGACFLVRWRSTDRKVRPTLRLPRKSTAWAEDPEKMIVHRSPHTFKPFVEFVSAEVAVVQAEMYLDCHEDWYGVEYRATGSTPVVLLF